MNPSCMNLSKMNWKNLPIGRPLEKERFMIRESFPTQKVSEKSSFATLDLLSVVIGAEAIKPSQTTFEPPKYSSKPTGAILSISGVSV